MTVPDPLTTQQASDVRRVTRALGYAGEAAMIALTDPQVLVSLNRLIVSARAAGSNIAPVTVWPPPICQYQTAAAFKREGWSENYPDDYTNGAP